jgi:hypothetical protein
MLPIRRYRRFLRTLGQCNMIPGTQFFPQPRQPIRKNPFIHVHQQPLILQKYLQQSKLINHHKLIDRGDIIELKRLLVVVPLCDFSLDCFYTLQEPLFQIGIVDAW